ncbi:hypothetical protein [Streptomyces sp. NPDC048111]|uniref:hypothetical protein n=1 Tax=Streptomyces sp. NPDC048111 TaxID=3365500 RepID=UPI00371EA0C2
MSKDEIEPTRTDRPTTAAPPAARRGFLDARGSTTWSPIIQLGFTTGAFVPHGVKG